MFQRLICTLLLIFFCILLCSSSVLSQDQNKQNGIKYINEGKYRQAIEELEKVILKNPRDAEALFYLGVAYRNLGSGQLKNALSGISQALKIRPNDPNWQYALAQTYDDMDKFGISLTDTNKTTYELAVEAYKRAIVLDPTSINAHLSLGELYLRKGKYELASEKFKDVIKIDPENESSYSYLVDCLCKLDRYDEAITNLNKWSNINANRMEPRNLKAKIYWYQGKYEEAQREYQKVIELDPSNQLARARLDTIITINQNKNRISQLLARGESLFNARQYDQAIVQFEEIRKINSNHLIANERLREARTSLSDNFFKIGIERVQNNDLDGAVANFNRALELAQSNSQMQKIIKRWQEAQQSLGEKAMIWEVISRGNNFRINKKVPEALSYFDVVLQEGWGNKDSVKVMRDSLKIANSYNFAANREESGDLIAALVFYKETLKLDSNYMDIRFRIEKLNGEIAFSRGEWSNAIKYYKRALQINPSNPFIINRIKQAKTSKYLPYVLLILLLIIIGSIIASLRIRNKKSAKPIVKNKTKLAVIASIIFVVLFLLVSIITLRSDQINFEQGFQLIGTVFIVFLFFISILIQKQTNVNFSLTARLIEFEVPNKDEITNTYKIFKDNPNCESIILKDFKHINLQIKSLNNDSITVSNMCELDIMPINEKAKNFKIKFSRKSEELSISSLELSYKIKVKMRKEKDSFQIYLKNELDSIDESNYSFNLSSKNETNLEVANCVVLLNNKPINSSTNLCSITFVEGSPINICCSRNQSICFEIKFDKVINDELLSIGEFEKVNRISLLDNELQSQVEEGTILIGNKERKMTRREYYSASPQSFHNVIIQAKGDNLFLKYYGYLKSLKIGLYNSINKQSEEIPNYAMWISKNPIFYIILGLLAWMSFLSAIRESNFIDNILSWF